VLLLVPASHTAIDPDYCSFKRAAARLPT